MSLEHVRERLARRSEMIAEGTYQRWQSRCADSESVATAGGHPKVVHWEMVKHPDYVSHLEAIADQASMLLCAVDAALAVHYESVTHADDIAEGGDEVPEDYERHYCNEDGEIWPCVTVQALATAIGET